MQNTSTTKATCRRCGDCCRNGGPALHLNDMGLIENGTIQLSNMVTLRPGERAYDQISQNVLPLDSEIIKVKGRDGTWTCTFFSPEGRNCGLYDNRPEECRLLFCREPEPLAEMYDKNRLNRTDLLPENHPLMELILEHDKRCAPLLMEEQAKKAREGDADAGRALKEMVAYDMEVRRLVIEKMGAGNDMTEFLFGRPLRTLLKTMNINVYEVGDTIRFNFGG